MLEFTIYYCRFLCKVALVSDDGSSAYLMPLIGSQQSRVSTR
jgi:hypothetical protein